MRIGLDVSQIVYEGTGVARFTEGLLDAVLEYGTQRNSWVFFYSSLRRSLPSQIRKKLSHHKESFFHLPLPPTLLSYLWNDLHLVDPSSFLGKLDWFISSDWTQPPVRSNSATVVHDLAFKRYPDTVHSSIRKVQEQRLKRVAKETNIIFCDSLSTKKDLVNYYQIADSRIIVNYPGLNQTKIIPAESSKLVNLGISKPFILTVGKYEPRKNFDFLIEAFNKINDDRFQLVIAGPQGWMNQKKVRNVILTGYVSDEVLNMLYSQCFFFAYPSLWEGFGYPLVEAMAHGKAVLTSNTSSLKEIANSYALLCDPSNLNDITSKLNMLINNIDLRKKLEALGKKRSLDYTWKSYYITMIKAFENYNKNKV